MPRAIKKVSPGKPGTKKLVEKYGDRFICMRYRNDYERNKRLKTIEIIIEEKELKPINKIPANKTMHLRVAYGEIEVASLVKHAGGKWNRAKKYWELPYQQVKSLGLEGRIINENV